MANKLAKMEDMLFAEFPSTYLSDFRKQELKEPVPTVYKPKPPRPDPAADWKPPTIPFYTTHKPRPIIDTNPWQVQEKFEKPEDKELERARQTRPRLVMPPAVSFDDVEDPRARSILCQDIYTTSTAKTMREVVVPCKSVQAPFAKHPAPANPVTLPKLQPYVVSPEWRMESVRWDDRQLRAHCDTTAEFWLRLPLPKCRACDETAVMTAHRDKLRRKM